MATGYAPKLPLQYDEIDGFYKMNKTVGDVIKQNIKMVVLTSPGERMMNPEFGVGLRNYLFNPEASDVFVNLKDRINQQLEKYVPYARIINIQRISLQDIPGEPDPTNSMGVQLIYTVPNAGISDSLTITFKN
tara:strand:- start:34605 stop:35003 length:399 start_codon:yes stop_codon:yes gene_type:complete